MPRRAPIAVQVVEFVPVPSLHAVAARRRIEPLQLTFAMTSWTSDGIQPTSKTTHILLCPHCCDHTNKTPGHSSSNTVAMSPRPLHSSLAALLAHTCSAYTSRTGVVAAGAKLVANCSADGLVGTSAVTAGQCCTHEAGLRHINSYFRIEI